MGKNILQHFLVERKIKHAIDPQEDTKDNYKSFLVFLRIIFKNLISQTTNFFKI